MCGIAGYLGAELPGLGADMAARLRHRGPDESGEAVLAAGDGRSCVLAHRRLSIIDLAGGHQPHDQRGRLGRTSSSTARSTTSARCAGELEAKGHRFATRSDTEVLVHLYEEHGDDLVHRLRGMFAFALWDARRRRLLLARDRLGVKPLYYALPETGGIELAFASELKALLDVPGVSRELDLESLAAYLAYLYIPHPRTAVLGARRLPPGHLLVADGTGAEVRRYWGLDPDAIAEPDAGRLWELVSEAVDLRLVADVPLGSFLSGGIDSSSIVAAASALQGPLDTFTVVFPRPEERLYDERDDARIVAAATGSRHHELEARADAQELLPELVRHFDEPFGNPTALLVHELSRLTRQHVKVALAGDGADELFAGYPRFRGLAAASLYRRVPSPVRALAAAGARALPESTRGRHSLRRAREFALAPLDSLESAYLSWITYFDAPGRADLLRPEIHERLRGSPPPERFVLDLFERAPRGDLVNRLSHVELQSFLPCNVLEYGDRMSMAHGLEVSAPFTDHRLVEHVLALPGSAKLQRGRSKAILREAAAPHLPARPLAKRKIGFNPPLGIWLNRELAPLVASHLSREQVEARGLFRPQAVGRLVESLRSGRRDVSLHVWSLIVLEQWQREYGAAA